jgi:[ribosomal protein S18]-alanine N-acetyltransferase
MRPAGTTPGARQGCAPGGCAPGGCAPDGWPPRPGYTGPVTPPTIRPAHEHDVPRLLELQAASPEAAQWSREQYRSALAGQVSLRCVVAESDGGVDGMIVFRGPLAGEAEILNLAVAPQARRRGIGGALVGAACEQPADLFLEVRRSNRGGIAFYRHCGFLESGCRKGYYRNPPEDAIVMKRASGAGNPGP